MPELKAASFDCHGTPVDSQGGLGAFLYDRARRSGESGPEPGRDPRRVLRALDARPEGVLRVAGESLWGLLELVES
jgi:hypothetical protein